MEVIGGLALLLGAFVVWASIPMTAVLLVAMLTVHLPYGFSSVKLLGVSASGAQFGPVGYELDLENALRWGRAQSGGFSREMNLGPSEIESALEFKSRG